eukprot:jgi/Mesvir1/15719/Mv03298-RA.1
MLGIGRSSNTHARARFYRRVQYALRTGLAAVLGGIFALNDTTAGYLASPLFASVIGLIATNGTLGKTVHATISNSFGCLLSAVSLLICRAVFGVSYGATLGTLIPVCIILAYPNYNQIVKRFALAVAGLIGFGTLFHPEKTELLYGLKLVLTVLVGNACALVAIVVPWPQLARVQVAKGLDELAAVVSTMHDAMVGAFLSFADKDRATVLLAQYATAHSMFEQMVEEIREDVAFTQWEPGGWRLKRELSSVVELFESLVEKLNGMEMALLSKAPPVPETLPRILQEPLFELTQLHRLVLSNISGPLFKRLTAPQREKYAAASAQMQHALALFDAAVFRGRSDAFYSARASVIDTSMHGITACYFFLFNVERYALCVSHLLQHIVGGPHARAHGTPPLKHYALDEAAVQGLRSAKPPSPSRANCNVTADKTAPAQPQSGSSSDKTKCDKPEGPSSHSLGGQSHSSLAMPMSHPLPDSCAVVVTEPFTPQKDDDSEQQGVAHRTHRDGTMASTATVGFATHAGASINDPSAHHCGFCSLAVAGPNIRPLASAAMGSRPELPPGGARSCPRCFRAERECGHEQAQQGHGLAAWLELVAGCLRGCLHLLSCAEGPSDDLGAGAELARRGPGAAAAPNPDNDSQGNNVGWRGGADQSAHLAGPTTWCRGCPSSRSLWPDPSGSVAGNASYDVMVRDDDHVDASAGDDFDEAGRGRMARGGAGASRDHPSEPTGVHTGAWAGADFPEEIEGDAPEHIEPRGPTWSTRLPVELSADRLKDAIKKAAALVATGLATGDPFGASTVGFIVGGYLGASFHISVLRVQGAVLGGIFGYLGALRVLDKPWAQGAILFALVSAFGFLRTSRVHGYVGVVASYMVPVIMLGYSKIVFAEPGDYVLDRIQQTVIAGLIYVAVEMVIWPVFAATSARVTLINVLRSEMGYFSSLYDSYVRVECPSCRARSADDANVLKGKIARALPKLKAYIGEAKAEPELLNEVFPVEVYHRFLAIERTMLRLLIRLHSALRAGTGADGGTVRLYHALIQPMMPSLVALRQEVLRMMRTLTWALQLGLTNKHHRRAQGVATQPASPTKSKSSGAAGRARGNRLLLLMQLLPSSINRLAPTVDEFDRHYVAAVGAMQKMSLERPELGILSNMATFSFNALVFSVREFTKELKNGQDACQSDMMQKPRD